MARRRNQSPTAEVMVVDEAQSHARMRNGPAASSESQQLLAFGSVLNQPPSNDQEVLQLRAKVSADKKQLKTLLQQHVRQDEEAEAQRRGEFSAAILDALRGPSQPILENTATFSHTKIAINAACLPIANVLAASEALLTEYSRIDSMITDLREEQVELDEMRRGKEIEDTESKLKMGARVALRQAKKALGASVDRVEENTESDGDETTDTEEAAETVKEVKDDLHKCLWYAEKGIEQIVKSMPMEE